MSAPGTQAGKIPSLDGLRGISFLIVFFAHDGFDKIVPGRLGVNIFFFLSGYLITTLLIRERAKTGWISLKLFYMRRTLRIFPPMYAIMAATLIYLWFAHHLQGVTLAGACSQAFYYQNYYFHDGRGLIRGLGVLWSLAVEEHFYLLFPPLMLLLLDRFKMNYKQIAVTLISICGGFLLWRCFVVAFFPHGLIWAQDTTDCRADSILFGCVLACWEQVPSIDHVFSRKRLERVILPGAVVVLLFTLLYRNPVFRETFRYTLQGLALAPILYYVVHAPTSLAGRFLNLRWLGVLGTLSYSLYLVHLTILQELNLVSSSRLICGVVGLPLAILLAYLVHVSIEKPTEQMRRHLRHTSNAEPRTKTAEPLAAPLVTAASSK